MDLKRTGHTPDIAHKVKRENHDVTHRLQPGTSFPLAGALARALLAATADHLNGRKAGAHGCQGQLD